MPGDKSISHRALIFGSLARGQTKIHGLLESEDVLHTLEAMRALGAKIERGAGAGQWCVTSITAETACAPQAPLDFGNSGTGARLVMGMVAGLGIGARFIGDDSLSGRPMGRVLNPLGVLGVKTDSHNGCLPVEVYAGSQLPARISEISIASAQVKSALLLAGIHADGVTEVIEPNLSRDHTERMLAAFGANISSTVLSEGRHRVRLSGPADLTGTSVTVPGDPSSAAFPITAALCIEGSDITLQGVLMNPTRTGFIKTAKRMGGQIDILRPRKSSGEDIADIRVRGSRLKGVTTEPDMVPTMIDEIPALAVLAAFADGITQMRGIGELRVKESDRIARCEDMLRSMGINVQSGKDWLRVEGAGALCGKTISAEPIPVRTDGDHRIAMAALVLGLAASCKIRIDNPTSIATSYPGFVADMRSLGANLEIEP